MIYFHPFLNKPPLSGGDVHSHEMLKTLKKMGYKIYLFILESKNRPMITKEGWGYEDLVVYSHHAGKPYIRKVFTEYIDKVQPDYIYMNYLSTDFYVDHERFKHIKKIMYNHHFETTRRKMNSAFGDAWNKVAATCFEEVSEELYDLDFFKSKDTEPDPEEYEILDKYDLSLVIQDYGAKLIEENSKKTKVVSFPVTMSPRECNPTFQKVALYPLSSYTFAYQGYYFFTKRVLPLILKKQPLFLARLTGVGTSYFFPSKNILDKRFVSNIKKEYERASLCLCPCIAGTGQQVKIVEAMHFGIPCVSMDIPTQFNPIEHGKTGFIAKNAEEFARYTLLLFNDPKFAREMGAKAQKVAREKYTNILLEEKFKAIESI